MKKVRVFIVTYKRSSILNDSLDKLFASDLEKECNSEVYVINNHTEFHLEERHKKKVKVLHNMTRPDWSNGNLGENWNQCLIHGFESLKNPKCDYVVTLQNDTSLVHNWCSNLLKMHNKYNFIVGKFGDNIVSYTPQAVMNIGMWDERFCGIQYKEADYWIRALIFNKNKSLINDTLHGIVLNNDNALDLDTSSERNFQDTDSGTKRMADDDEHQEIWNSSRGGDNAKYLLSLFKWKWRGTWKTQPCIEGWIKNWPEEFIKSPPTPPSKKMFIKYPYFEKHINAIVYELRFRENKLSRVLERFGINHED